LASTLADYGNLTIIYANSIQAWALDEAKARMEARAESVEYKPS
jgi:hypothetical protein